MTTTVYLKDTVGAEGERTVLMFDTLSGESWARCMRQRAAEFAENQTLLVELLTRECRRRARVEARCGLLFEVLQDCDLQVVPTTATGRGGHEETGANQTCERRAIPDAQNPGEGAA